MRKKGANREPHYCMVQPPSFEHHACCIRRSISVSGRSIESSASPPYHFHAFLPTNSENDHSAGRSSLSSPYKYVSTSTPALSDIVLTSSAPAGCAGSIRAIRFLSYPTCSMNFSSGVGSSRGYTVTTSRLYSWCFHQPRPSGEFTNGILTLPSNVSSFAISPGVNPITNVPRTQLSSGSNSRSSSFRPFSFSTMPG